MSNMLKCPNPTCPYVFDPSQVPVGVVLSCPRCGMQFTLGAPAVKIAPPPAYPTAPPPNYPSGSSTPTAPSTQSNNAQFEAVGRTAVEERDPNAPQPSRRASKAPVLILAGIAAVLMAGTALTIIFKLMHRGDSGSEDSGTPLHDLNIGVGTPPTGWTLDDHLRVKVGSPFVMAYKRESPEAYMLFGASEAPKGRSPRPSEMRADLNQLFRKIEMPEVRESDPEETKWLGETIAKGLGFNFRVQSSDGLAWKGEAYSVAHKGIAYYWVSWCGEKDYEGIKDEFAKFRGKFKLLQTRNDWKETQSNIIEYKGYKVPYTISDAEELWKEVPAADVELLRATEPDLERRLRSYITPKRDSKARPDEAELSVYVLDGTGDPLQVARKYLEDKETARLKGGGDYTLTFKELTAADPPMGDPTPPVVPATAPVTRLVSNVKESPSNSRLFVVSATQVGNKIVIVHCWCTIPARETFETKFVQIAASLR